MTALQTAVLIPSAAPAIDLRTPIAGLPILMRIALTLQRAGVTELRVLGDVEESLRRLIANDRRVTMSVRWLPSTSEISAANVPTGSLVIRGTPVFSCQLIESVRGEASAEAPSLIFLDAEAAAHPLEGESWYLPVRTCEDARRAEQRLSASMKGKYEGFVDRYFNRRLSAPLTRLFLAAGVSANAVTVLSILIGLIGAVAFSIGTYGMAVLGAVLFQLAAVVDCSDGEVARLTFSESRLGHQLDLIGDNVVHMAIFGALGWAGFQQHGSMVPLGLAAAAIIGNALALTMVMQADNRRARGALRSPVQAARVDFLLSHVASRDFSVIVLLFTLAQALPLFLWLAAIGSNVFWMVTAWITHAAPRPA